MALPEKKFEAGAIVATVWKNQGNIQGKTTEYSTVSLERRYYKDGKWLNASSMRANDLPKAALVLQKAYEYLTFKKQEEQMTI